MMGSIGTSAGPIQEEVELMVDVESRVTYLAEAHAVAEGAGCRAGGPEPGGATVNWAGGVWAGGKPGRWAGCRAWLAKSKWESLLAGAGGGFNLYGMKEGGHGQEEEEVKEAGYMDDK